jgi:hypothetical protein
VTDDGKMRLLERVMRANLFFFEIDHDADEGFLSAICSIGLQQSAASQNSFAAHRKGPG